MLNNNYGYACINMQLSYPKIYNQSNRKITTNRTMIKKTFINKGINYASELGLKNCKDLLTILQWNKKNNFNFFRITSNLFPWCSEYRLQDLPDYKSIKNNTDQNYVSEFYKRRQRRTGIGVVHHDDGKTLHYVIKTIPKYVRAEGWHGRNAIVIKNF